MLSMLSACPAELASLADGRAHKRLTESQWPALVSAQHSCRVSICSTMRQLISLHMRMFMWRNVLILDKTHIRVLASRSGLTGLAAELERVPAPEEGWSLEDMEGAQRRSASCDADSCYHTVRSASTGMSSLAGSPTRSKQRRPRPVS